MQVVTTVKTTIQEVKKALRLLNPNLPSEFVLEIDYNTEGVDTQHNQDTTEQQSQPWYPDDSEGWIDVPEDWNNTFCPTKFDEHSLLDVEFKIGQRHFNVLSPKSWNAWLQVGSQGDIVKYRASKQQTN